MKRFIKLKTSEVTPDEVTFTVEEQTHRNTEFSQQGPGNGNSFQAYNGISLKSFSTPEVSKRDDSLLYLRGDCTSQDGKQLQTTPEKFRKILEAVQEYNDTDGVGYHKDTSEARKRYIELRVTETGTEKMEFVVNKQTHRCGEFSKQPATHEFKASNGAILGSYCYPDNEDDWQVFLRGEDEEQDHDSVSVTPAQFTKILEAVQEYNDTDGVGYPTNPLSWPQPDDPFYYVGAQLDVYEQRVSNKWADGLKKAGNIFKTEEEAEAASTRIRAALSHL